MSKCQKGALRGFSLSCASLIHECEEQGRERERERDREERERERGGGDRREWRRQSTAHSSTIHTGRLLKAAPIILYYAVNWQEVNAM